jgi:hypothetical protein
MIHSGFLSGSFFLWLSLSDLARNTFRSDAVAWDCQQLSLSVLFRCRGSSPRFSLMIVAVSDPCPMIHSLLALLQVLARRVLFTVLLPVTLGSTWVLGIGGGRLACSRSVQMIAKRELGSLVLGGLLSFLCAVCASCWVLHSLVHALHLDNMSQPINICPGRWTTLKSSLSSSSFQHWMVWVTLWSVSKNLVCPLPSVITQCEA